MTFRKWPSIENSYRDKNVAWWLERHPGLRDATYVITEKLHGSNVQIHAGIVDGSEVTLRYGSRNQFCEGSSLFGWPSNAGAVLVNSVLVSETLGKIMYATRRDITIYGELIGPGVQKGVDYGQDKRIYWFGALVGSELMDYAYLRDELPDELHVPIVGVAYGIEAALEYSPDFVSRIKSVDGNTCEGIVIQPATPVRDEDSWFMLKHKNPEFLERKAQKAERAPDLVVDPLHTVFLTYITEARVDTVESKLGPIEDRAQMGMYIKAVLQDAREEMAKDYDLTGLDKNQLRAVYNVGSIAAQMLLRRIQ